MMKTIATLDVIISDGIGDRLGFMPSGMLSPANDGTRDHYTVTLRPKVDGPILDSIRESRNLDNVETLLAHELGHFVATLFADPSHDKRLKLLSMLLNDSSINLEAEKKAWEIGEKIYPQLNQRIKEKALQGYASNGMEGAVS